MKVTKSVVLKGMRTGGRTDTTRQNSKGKFLRDVEVIQTCHLK